MLVKQGHEPAVGKGKLPRGAQSRFRPPPADLGFYEQVMRSAEFGDDLPGLVFSFLLANGFDQEPLQAEMASLCEIGLVSGAHSESVRLKSSRRKRASSLSIPIRGRRARANWEAKINPVAALMA